MDVKFTKWEIYGSTGPLGRMAFWVKSVTLSKYCINKNKNKYIQVIIIKKQKKIRDFLVTSRVGRASDWATEAGNYLNNVFLISVMLHLLIKRKISAESPEQWITANSLARLISFIYLESSFCSVNCSCQYVKNMSQASIFILNSLFLIFVIYEYETDFNV